MSVCGCRAACGIGNWRLLGVRVVYACMHVCCLEDVSKLDSEQATTDPTHLKSEGAHILQGGEQLPIRDAVYLLDPLKECCQRVPSLRAVTGRILNRELPIWHVALHLCSPTVVCLFI